MAKRYEPPAQDTAGRNDHTTMTLGAVIRLKQVQQLTGLSRSGIYAKMANGEFPGQIHLGARAVGWLRSEIDAWIADLVSARDSGMQ